MALKKCICLLLALQAHHLFTMSEIQVIKSIRDHATNNNQKELFLILNGLFNEFLQSQQIPCQTKVVIIGLLKEKEHISPPIFTILEKARKNNPKTFAQLENIYLDSLQKPVVLLGC